MFSLILYRKFVKSQFNFKIVFSFFLLFFFTGHNDRGLHFINSFNNDFSFKKRWCYFNFKSGKSSKLRFVFSFLLNFHSTVVSFVQIKAIFKLSRQG